MPFQCKRQQRMDSSVHQFLHTSKKYPEGRFFCDPKSRAKLNECRHRCRSRVKSLSTKLESWTKPTSWHSLIGLNRLKNQKNVNCNFSFLVFLSVKKFQHVNSMFTFAELLVYLTWLSDNNLAKCFPKMPKTLNFGLAGIFWNLQLITAKLFKFAVSGTHIGGSNFRENNASFDFVWKYEEIGKFI